MKQDNSTNKVRECPTNTTQVFINYRGDDANIAQHIIYDKLEKHLSCEHIFLDVKNIDLGDKFDDRINQTLASSVVLLVLIGEKWVQILKERELLKQKDWVRKEIEFGLDSPHCTVIPIYLSGNNFMQPEDFSNNIKKLASISAETLYNSSLENQLEILAKRLIKIIYGYPFDFLSSKLRTYNKSQNDFNYIYVPISSTQSLIKLSMKDYFNTPFDINTKDLENRNKIQIKVKNTSYMIFLNTQFIIHVDYSY